MREFRNLLDTRDGITVHHENPCGGVTLCGILIDPAVSTEHAVPEIISTDKAVTCSSCVDETKAWDK